MSTLLKPNPRYAEESNMDAFRRYIPTQWIWLAEFIEEVYNRYSADYLPLAAGAISFFTVLSLIPLLLFAVTVAPTYLTTEKLGTLSQAFGSEFATALHDQILTIVKQRLALRSVAIAFGFWTGSQVFLILELSINLVWRSRKKRTYWMRRGLSLVMVVIIGTLMLGSVVLTNLISVLRRMEVPLWGHQVQDIPLLIDTLITIVVPTLLVTAIFAVIYYVLPTKRVTFRTVVPGALFAGFLWALSLHLFGWYARYFVDYRIIYGSLGGLILLMFWFYYSAFIMLLGAEISATFHRHLVTEGDMQEREVDQM